MKITVKVYFQSGENAGEEVISKTFDDGVYRIGRSDFSDLVLPAESVSRSHVELRVTESAVYMTNMASAGKVKLNGKSKETSEVADGDTLLVGPYKIIVFHGERDSEPAAEAPAENAVDGGSPPGDAGGGFPAFGQDGSPSNDAPAGFETPDNGAAAAGFGFDNGAGMDGGVQGGDPALKLEEEGPAVPSIQKAETQFSLKPVVAKLLFVEGPRQGEELFLEAYEVTFGRSKRADIYLDDHKLSRVHAKIARVGMGYRLIDLNSRNGTYVNGMRVLEHPLNSFDQIEIGSTKIKFLIHDMLVGEMARRSTGGTVAFEGNAAVDQTRSMQLAALDPAMVAELRATDGPVADVLPLYVVPDPVVFYKDPKKRKMLILGIVLALGLSVLFLPGGDKKTKGAEGEVKDKLADVKLPPAMPKEYAELSPELQRTVEGLYNTAQKAAEAERYDEATASLKKIHEYIPFYKQSKDLLDQYAKKLKERQLLEAQEKAKKDEKQDLSIYLEEGTEYLRDGDFERAAESFNSAIVIDPTNQTAIKGLKAAEAKVRDVNLIPADKDPEEDKRKLVNELFQKAVGAFTTKSYQEAIDTAEKIRAVEIRGDTQYLNEAKQIIDRSRAQQKEEFEPFLIQAKEKYAEGDYNASRDLCEEMLKRDGAYEEAKECVLKAKKQLNRLAKEAYTHGYILESMNRIEEAKQYWNRARNYVRTGDDYFDKVTKKLDYYQ